MTRQEPKACGRVCKRRPRPWLASGKKGSRRAPCVQPAHQLQESQSVFESGPLRKPACIFTPFREPACILIVRREASGGEDSTDFFRKAREMTSLWPSPRRKPSVRPGAHLNGLWDVQEARTSPLVPPESHRFGSLLSPGSRIFAEKYRNCLRKNSVKISQARFRGLPEPHRRQISVL